MVHGKTITMSCNSPFVNLGSTSATCSYGNWQWNSNTGECGCDGGYYIKLLTENNYYIKYCSNTNHSASVRCDVDKTETYGAMRIGQTSRTSDRGSYKNIKINNVWVTDDSGLCYIK